MNSLEEHYRKMLPLELKTEWVVIEKKIKKNDGTNSLADLDYNLDIIDKIFAERGQAKLLQILLNKDGGR